MKLLGMALSLMVATISLLAQEKDNRLVTAGNGPEGVPQATFFAHRLGSDHAEGVTSLDIDGDGFKDLLSGAYWYKNPGAAGGDWVRHQYREVGTLNEFVSDCGEWTVDVNHDGKPDVVTTGWMVNGLWWFENPGPGVAGMWKAHLIADSYDTEGGAMADINGDGKPEIILAHYNHSGILWVDFAGAAPKVHHLGDKTQDGHGTGVADVDGDGKADILTPFGWFKNIDADHDKFEWHGDWKLGDAGFPILGLDVNGDGKMDILFGEGHSYGVYWLEQKGTGANRSFVQHAIDESFSQAHALKLVDIDDDGQVELLAGKRYRGHAGNDPGSYDPLVIYAYKLDQKTAKFTRVPISVNGIAGAGTQFVAEDLDGDGDVDVAVAGKTGLFFFENLKVNKVPKAQREKEILLEKNWPFAGEGHAVVQENGPTAQ
jgi:hypothetical protein